MSKFQTTNTTKGGLVDRYINTSYDIVVYVANNMDAITTVYSSINSGQLTTIETAINSGDIAAAIAAVASTAADAAATAADVITVAAIYDSFDDRYLGSKTGNPTLDNDGNALLEGALYWNSTIKEMRVYNGTTWQVAYTGNYVAISDSLATGVYATISDNSIAMGSGGAAMQANWDTVNGDVLLLGDRTAIYDWNSTFFSNNAVWNGASWEYAVTGYSQLITLGSTGYIALSNAASGTAAAAITFEEQLRLLNDGELSLKGATASLSMLERVSGPAFTANYGKLWVKSIDSNLWFTKDDGTEIRISTGAASTLNEGVLRTMVDSDYQEGMTANAARAVTLGNLINNGAVHYSKYCTADTTINNSIALTSITGMAIDFEYGAYYAVEICLILDQASVEDIKVQFQIGSSDTLQGVWDNTGNAVYSRDLQITYGDTAQLQTEISTYQVITFRGRIYINGPDATAQVRFAQAVAEVADTTIKAGSWVRLTLLKAPI